MRVKTFASKRNMLLLSLCLGQMLGCATLPVLAGDGVVSVAGHTVLVNKSGSGDQSADERTKTIQRNLDNALVATADRSANAVKIVYANGSPILTLGGYRVATVDGANAKAFGTTPSALAKKWSDQLKQALSDSSGVEDYIAQLTGQGDSGAPPVAPPATRVTPPAYPGGQAYQDPAYPPAPYQAPPVQPYQQPPYAGQPQGYNQPGYTPRYQGRVTYAPAGLQFSAILTTSISTQVAREGDLVEASVSQPVYLGDSQIPAGSVVIGQITDAKASGRLNKSGTLGIKFNRMRLPDGTQIPITAHIVGGIAKYDAIGSDESGVYKGETWKAKAGQAAIRTGVGAGAGAALGTAIGAIAGGGRGAGRGAWSGTAIGGGLGLADSLILRKGREVNIASGTPVQIQLDAPVAISGGGAPPYTGAF